MRATLAMDNNINRALAERGNQRFRGIAETAGNKKAAQWRLMAACYRLCSYSKTMGVTMANFIVTFKFKSDDTRSERYDSFVKKINELTNYEHWDETTSFYCFEADTTAEALCSALYVGSDFNSTKDIMVVIDVSNKQKATKGDLQWPSLLDSYLGF